MVIARALIERCWWNNDDFVVNLPDWQEVVDRSCTYSHPCLSTASSW